MSKIYYPNARCAITVILDSQDGSDPAKAKRETIWAIPKSINVYKNPDTQADSYDCEFELKDFPFDPAQIRAGEVAIYLYQTPGQSDATLVPSLQSVGPLQTYRNDTTSRTVGDIDAIRSKGNWPLMQGRFDEPSLSAGEDGFTVSLSGQDYTDIFLALQWPPTSKGAPRKVPVGKKLDAFISDCVSAADPTGLLKVAYEGCNASQMPQIGQGASSGSKFGIPVEQNTKYWDVMSKTCRRMGYSLYVDSTFVIIKSTKSQDERAKRRVYRLDWGQNISTFSASRKMGQIQSPEIVVVSYDAKKKKSVYGEWPSGARERTKKNQVPATSKKGLIPVKSGEYQIIPAPDGVTSKDVLDRYAKEYFEKIVRGEYTINLQTMDLNDSSENDLLQIKSGDVMSVVYDLYRLGESNAGEDNMARAQYLQNRGFNSRAAQIVAENYEKLRSFNRPYIVRQANFSFGADSGFSLELELIEAVLVNASANDSRGRSEKRKDKYGSEIIKPINANLTDLNGGGVIPP